ARFRQPRRLRRIDEQKREPRGKTQTGHRSVTPVLREMGEPRLFGVFVHGRYAPEMHPRLWRRPPRQQAAWRVSTAYLLPRLLSRPSIVLSPVESCFGTSPSQAPKSRPLVKAAPFPIVGTTALAVRAPIPGALISRRQPSSWRASA